MTKDEAMKMKRFKNMCTCGGYAWTMNNRSESQPHTVWCSRYQEHAEWYKAMHLEETDAEK